MSASISGPNGSSAQGSKPSLESMTTACAKSRVARASSASARLSLPQVPVPESTASRPAGSPPIPLRRSTVEMPTGQGAGAGRLSARLSAWLPKRR